MNAVIYARFSSYGQSEQSIEGQLDECYKYAEKHGYTVIKEYIDRAQSATTDNRPSFRQMIEESKRKEFEIVLVYRLDRFSRDTMDSAIYEYTLNKNGVRVVSVNENISDDANGVLLKSVLVGVNAFFSKELSQKVNRGMNLNAQKGLSNGGTLPLGIKVGKDKRLCIDEEMAPVVRYIFDAYASGATIKSIVEHLNAQGYKSAKGNKFTPNSLQNMLKNKKYMGTYTYKEHEIPGALPAIISEEVFYMAQQRKNKASKTRSSNAKVEFLLTTKLFCGHCKTAMHGISGTSKTGSSHYYYQCGGRRRGCAKKNVRKDKLEETVLTAIMEQLTDDNVAKIAEEVAAESKREFMAGNVQRLEREVKALEKQKLNLLAAIKQGKAMDVLLDELDSVDGQIKGTQAQISKEKMQLSPLDAGDIIYFLTALRERAAERPDDYNRILIDVLVNKIYLYDDHIILVLNTDGEPVEITTSMLDAIESKDPYNAKNSAAEGVRDTNLLACQKGTTRTFFALNKLFVVILPW